MMQISISKDKTWSFELGQQWVVTGPVSSGKTWLARQLITRYPEEVALVTFDQQTPVDGADWQGARYHDSLDYSEALKTVDEALTYEAVNSINPFEIRPAETKKRAAFKKLRTRLEKQLHLTPLLDRTTLQLSNGEARRLLLACAVLRQTPILVLDDPFAGLDPSMQTMLRDFLDTLAKEGRTLIIMVRNDDEIPPCIDHRLDLLPYDLAAQGPYKPPRRTAIKGLTIHKNPPSLKTPEVISINDLTVDVGSKQLFNGLNWSVHAGERWLIIGPNGSGKTTLLSLIVGDNPMVYACDIEVFGKKFGPDAPLWTIRSRIATVSPESQACTDPTQTAEQVVLSGLFNREGLRKKPTAAQRKEGLHWLTVLGLHERAHDTLGTLSAGHVRLLLVARALLGKPDLLLLDELCMNLETEERQLLLKLLNKLLDENPTLTTLYIAHRQDHIPPHFDWTLHL